MHSRLFTLAIAAVFVTLVGAGCSPSKPANSWSGTWTNIYSPAVYDTLTIDNETSSHFHFILDGYYGADTGHMEATATIKQAGKIATAHLVESNNICDVQFILNTSSLKVSTENNCSYYAGAGVDFTGDYTLGEDIPTSSLSDLQALHTPALEDAFTKLIGNQADTFIISSMMQDEVTDEALGATGYSGAVYGLYSINENIILTAGTTSIWAAVIDPDDSRLANYYTNIPQYRHRAPKAIREWASERGLKIIYKS